MCIGMIEASLESRKSLMHGVHLDHAPDNSLTAPSSSKLKAYYHAPSRAVAKAGVTWDDQLLGHIYLSSVPYQQ